LYRKREHKEDEMEFFDSHSHYNDEKFDIDREEILKEIQEAGVTMLVVAGYNIKSSESAIAMAKHYGNIYATTRNIS